MIVYLDTSSLVKLYVEEESSAYVAELVQASKYVTTSLIAYTEARAAFARRYREKAFSQSQYRRLITFFDHDWDRYLTVRVTSDLVRMGGKLAEKHSLRGFDAIHLSSALTLQRELSSPITFSCFERRLQNASAVESLDQPR
jgi:uncharacterized protein